MPRRSPQKKTDSPHSYDRKDKKSFLSHKKYFVENENDIDFIEDLLEEDTITDSELIDLI